MLRSCRRGLTEPGSRASLTPARPGKTLAVMNSEGIADPDGPAIELRGWNPLRGRGWLVALFTVALAADFGMRLTFALMIGSLVFLGADRDRVDQRAMLLADTCGSRRAFA